MEKYFSVINASPLFAGIKGCDMEEMLACLDVWTKEYKKGEFIYRAGDCVQALGMILKGSVHVIREDFWGNRNIITQIEPGEIFAETYACLNVSEISVDVEASETAEVMFLDVREIMAACGSPCRFHLVLVRNLLNVLAGKNLLLSAKLGYHMRRSIREKVLSYLSEQSEKAHSAEFVIPFNRQQLADYLSVDRSALSSELGKLRREGLIEFHKNKFELRGSVK